MRKNHKSLLLMLALVLVVQVIMIPLSYLVGAAGVETDYVTILGVRITKKMVRALMEQN